MFDLKQHKIKLMHNYKRFKSDVHVIQNKLNDLEIMTPTIFSNIIEDASISVRNILLYKTVSKLI